LKPSVPHVQGIIGAQRDVCHVPNQSSALQLSG